MQYDLTAAMQASVLTPSSTHTHMEVCGLALSRAPASMRVGKAAWALATRSTSTIAAAGATPPDRVRRAIGGLLRKIAIEGGLCGGE